MRGRQTGIQLNRLAALRYCVVKISAYRERCGEVGKRRSELGPHTFRLWQGFNSVVKPQQFPLAIAVELADFALKARDDRPAPRFIVSTARRSGHRGQYSAGKHGRHGDEATGPPRSCYHKCELDVIAILLEPRAAVERCGARSEHCRSSVTNVLPPDCPEI